MQTRQGDIGQGSTGVFSSIQASGMQGQRARSVRQLSQWRSVYLISVLCLLTGIASSAQTFTVLADFDKATGYLPYSQALVQGFDGNFYGTTQTGGAHGSGTVFKLTPSGTVTAIYSFCAQQHCADGANPGPGLVLNTDGNFYGSATNGGAYSHGTIFKITPVGTLTTLHSFCQQTSCPDGRPPSAMVLAADGNFYGTTDSRGAHNYYGGTIFKITPSGSLTTLYSFCALPKCADGREPNGLIQATDGNFYGTTLGDTVFKVTASGILTTLYTFCSQKVGTNCLDGSFPYAPLVQSAGGTFYGTTGVGGANGYGTVFKITSSGTLTTLYSFCSQNNCTDGSDPQTALVQATDGKLYGTTTGGGGYGNGTVFKITSGGTPTTLYSFCSQTNCTDGSEPNGLLQATNGNFYGTTISGGNSLDGVSFRLSAGLSPFVEALPTSGKVGAAIKILGTNLIGATSVSFNGTAATFTVVSKSEIKTTVPAGATTGRVMVDTPGGILKSNIVFRVRP